MMHSFSSSKKSGLTLVETVIGVALFLIISTITYTAYVNLYELISISKDKVTASALSNEMFEIIRNMPYADVGIEGGIPTGTLPRAQEFVRNNATFYATTTIRNIDDPFDGTIGGSPNDLSPADSKLVDILIGCPGCKSFSPLHFTTRVGPKNLETASDNGALFIQVIDANGQPIVDADVHISNTNLDPVITFDETTDNNGMLQLVDVPPDVQGYSVHVTKSGYSASQTYALDDLSPSTPLHPDVTVILQQVTQVTFIIDQTSDLHFATVNRSCDPVSSVDFSLKGTKLIGINPDQTKYTANKVTNSLGELDVWGAEWDTYSLDVTDLAYQLEGSSPATLLDVSPGTDYDVMLVLGSYNPSALLVTVRDNATLQPLSGATVTLTPSSGSALVETTGRGYLNQTDWSGGSGQIEFEQEDEYFSSDGDIDTTSPSGDLKLQNVFGSYVADGELVSSIFDTGETSNFGKLNWAPQDQSVGTGAESVRLQIATSNATSTVDWVFRGPDGATTTYYSLAETDINPIHNGDRYVRYKVILSTEDDTVTPNVSDISFTFTTDCVPPGQAIFDGLDQGDYILDIEASGYQTQSESVTVGSSWQQREIILNLDE